MRPGQEVRYIDEDDKAHTATIKAIVGSGPSNYKLLDLSYRADGEEQVVEKVCHQGDAEEGQGFWLLKGERKTRGVDDEAENAEPTVDTTAFPEPPRTAVVKQGETNPSGRIGKEDRVVRKRA